MANRLKINNNNFSYYLINGYRSIIGIFSIVSSKYIVIYPL